MEVRNTISMLYLYTIGITESGILRYIILSDKYRFDRMENDETAERREVSECINFAL